MLHCGLHAVNAIVRAVVGDPCDAAELDEITARVHSAERQLCDEGRDTVPQTEGNYPVETLLVALRKRDLVATYERRQNLVPGRHVVVPREVVGFLLGTGTHYLALVRGRAGAGASVQWHLWDNGNEIEVGAWPPFTIIHRLAPSAVLRVVLHCTPQR